MVLDALKPWSHYEILTRELESMGIRLNRSPPNIYFKVCPPLPSPVVCPPLPFLVRSPLPFPLLLEEVKRCGTPRSQKKKTGGVTINATIPLTKVRCLPPLSSMLCPLLFLPVEAEMSWEQ